MPSQGSKRKPGRCGNRHSDAIPAVVFVNKMDRTGASFSRTLDSARTKLSANTVALQLPIGSEENFDGVDLVGMKRIEGKTRGEAKPRW